MLSKILFLFSCGSLSLPEKQNLQENFGILAIPKVFIKEASGSPGWANQIKILDSNGDEGDPITIYHKLRRGYFIVKHLNPGTYKINQMRSIPIADTALGDAKPWRHIGNRNFTIYAGKVTVLSTIFSTTMKSTGGTSWQMYDRFYAFDKEEFIKFDKIMKKYNKKPQWDIVWSWGNNFHDYLLNKRK